MLAGDHLELLKVLLRGAIRPDGTTDDALLKAAVVGWKRSLFLTRGFERLHGLATVLSTTVRQQGWMKPTEAPGRALIAQAAEAEEGCSLQGLLSIRKAVQLILERGADIPAIATLYEYLKRHYGDEPDVLASGSIVPALYSPDPKLIIRLRDELAPGKGIADFSRVIMAGTLGSPTTERNFLHHLTEGYDAPPSVDEDGVRHPRKGRFKLTEGSAQLLWSGLKKAAGEAVTSLPEFEDFAPISATAGPRRGQISKALRRSWGNLTP